MYLSIYLSVCLSIYLPVYPSIHASISSAFLTIYLSTYLPIYLSLYLSLSLSVCLPACLAGCLSVCLSVSLSTCLSASLKTKLLCETSSGFELDNIKNAAILPDFLNISTWQRQKRSNSARLPHFSKLTTSKTKEFCETSFKHGKLSAELTASYQCILRFFQSICLNYCAYQEKVMPGHTKCCTWNNLSKPEDLMLQNATPLRKSPPGPPNSSDEDVSCTAPATENASLQILFKCPTPSSVLGNATKPSRFAHFWQGPQSLARATRKHIWTSKSGANMLCFVHFDFEMCFAPQRRALFRHRSFQKWSGPGVFCTFWLGHVLRATTACAFSTSQLPKVVGTWCVLYILTSKCASRNNGVQFFISAALASLLFDPPEPQIIGKTQCFATFLPFRAPASSFFWLFLFSDFFLSSILLSSTVLFSLTLPISAFHLSILSEVWLLNFLRLSSITLISGPKHTIDPIWTQAFPGFIVRANGLESRRNFTSVFSSTKVPPTM